MAGMAATVWKSVSEYVHSLGLDAYLVGGGVRDRLLGRPSRDEDFVVPGLGHDELAEALRPHGRVEDLEVAGRVVGVRLHPRDQAARALAPGGIEFAPPRRERSTGPGRHDFEIVADASISLEEDMRRRDFTINAIAQRVSTGELVDPLGGEGDLRRGVLRTVSGQSFREDPLRLVRALRFVSELDVEPDETTFRQLRQEAARVRIVSGERVGGGLTADGMGELSKLLLGRRPAHALRLARDTGVLVELLPEYGPAIGYGQRAARQHLTLDEHLFETVQAAAGEGERLEVRLALLLHDLGKPAAERDEGDHAAIGARLAAAILGRLRYPTRLRRHVVRIVERHAFPEPGAPTALDARRFLHAHGEELAIDLLAHKRADLAAKSGTEKELGALEAFGALLAGQRAAPYRLDRLAVDGRDLIALGVPPGPELGLLLRRLLDLVVEEPERNTREELLAAARGLADGS
jgi:tRNA nucleotidyltransferase (CCA-adding enzyme)